MKYMASRVIVVVDGLVVGRLVVALPAPTSDMAQSSS